MPNGELILEAAQVLVDVDERRSFWIDLAVVKEADVGRENLDWGDVPSEVRRWLDGLDLDAAPALRTFRLKRGPTLLMRARGRVRMARGLPKASYPSAEASTPVYLVGGLPRTLDDLTLEEVREFARGEKRVEVDFASYRPAFEALAEAMEVAGVENSSQLEEAVSAPVRLMLEGRD